MRRRLRRTFFRPECWDWFVVSSSCYACMKWRTSDLNQDLGTTLYKLRWTAGAATGPRGGGNLPYMRLMGMCHWVAFSIELPNRKVPKINSSMSKPLQIQAPQTRNAKNPPLNRPSKYKPPGGLYLEIALKYKVKQSKNGKFPSNYKASTIDFETHHFPP